MQEWAELNALVERYQKKPSTALYLEIARILQPKIYLYCNKGFDITYCDIALKHLLLKYRHIGKNSNFLGYFHRYFGVYVRDFWRKEMRHRGRRRGFRNKGYSQAFRRFVISLPRRTGEVIDLYFNGGHNATVISKVLGISPSTVRTIKQVALGKLWEYDSTNGKVIYGQVRNRIWRRK